MSLPRSSTMRKVGVLAAAAATAVALSACSGSNQDAVSRVTTAPPTTAASTPESPTPSPSATPTPTDTPSVTPTPTPSSDMSALPLKDWNWSLVHPPVDCKGRPATTAQVQYLDLTADGTADAVVLATCPSSVHSNGVAVYDGKTKQMIGTVGGATAAWGVITKVTKGEAAHSFDITVPDLEGQDYPATVREFTVRSGKLVKIDEYVTAPD